jgi:hypothetical protein
VTDAAEPSITGRDRLVEGHDRKRWEALVGYEVHRMWAQNDLGGDAPNKLFNYWYASFRFDITGKDRLRVRFGVYERFLADQGESGLNSDDISLSYTRVQDLPWGLNLAASFALTIPVSDIRHSEGAGYTRLAGTITAPSLSLDLSRKFFGLLTLAVRPFGVVYWQTYTAEVGGNVNPIGRIGISADAFVELPFFPALTIGGDVYTGYSWYYSPNGVLPAGQFPGTSQDPTYATQPIQQAYGGEFYVRYAVPEFFGIKSDVTVALANGDPTLGYTSRLHDGQAYLYGSYRHDAEVYANLTVRY